MNKEVLKMTSKKELEQMRDEIIENYIDNLDETQLKSSIDNLTKNCFLCFLNNDESMYNSYIVNLKELANTICGQFDNIYDYINYSFLMNMNELLNELLNKSFDLKTIYSSNLRLNPDEHAKIMHTKEYFDFHHKLLTSSIMREIDEQFFEHYQVYEKNKCQEQCKHCKDKQRCEDGKHECS